MAKKEKEDIQLLKDTIQRQQEYISNLEKQLQNEHEKNNTISKAEFEGLLKQLEREAQAKNQYKVLYEKEKEKRNNLIKTYQNKIDTPSAPEPEVLPDGGIKYPIDYETLCLRVKELETQLRVKNPSGRKRNNNTADDVVISLREQGKSLREIAKETKLSINTIRDILKSVSK